MQTISARFRALSRRTQVIIGSVSALVLLCTCCGTIAAIGNSATTTNTHTSVAAPATVTAKPKPTATPQIIHYPPTTQADLQGLAAKGDASAVHEFHSESVGLTGVCPQPKREVVIDPSITGKQLAEDLLAYYYAQSLNNPCGSLVLAYRHQSDADTIGYYTAGRINLDVNDANGQGNIDPNGTNLKYTLTLDVGDVISGQGQEYIVTY